MKSLKKRVEEIEAKVGMTKKEKRIESETVLAPFYMLASFAWAEPTILDRIKALENENKLIKEYFNICVLTTEKETKVYKKTTQRKKVTKKK